MCEPPRRIQLSRKRGWRLPEGAVVVARPSRWGNPFTAAKAIEAGYAKPANANAFVVECFREWLTPGYHSGLWWMGPESDAKKAEMRKGLADLRGKNLACWCPPGAACHADVLLELANHMPRCEAVGPAP
jgi:hypothetical protein